MKLLQRQIEYLERLIILVLILFWFSTISLAFMMQSAMEPVRGIATELKKAKRKGINPPALFDVMATESGNYVIKTDSITIP